MFINNYNALIIKKDLSVKSSPKFIKDFKKN